MIKRLTLSTILLCGGGFVMAEDVTPAQVEATDSTTKMESMQIRATAAEQPAVPANVPNTVEGVTAKQISESINAVTTPQVLQYLPSVHVRERYIGDFNSILVMRVNSSVSSAQTTVYADDLLLSNFLNNSFSTAPRWNMVSPEEIERVDVMYGPFSALYPGNSAGGVVVLKTKMPEKFEAHAKFDYFGQNFNLYGTDNYYDGVHGAASIGSKYNDFSFIVSGDHLDNHGHPMTFTAATVKTGSAPTSAQFTAVNGAYNDIDTSGNARVTTAAASIDHAVQDNLKIKLAYDISPTVRASYTLGLWQNDSEKRGESYLTNGAGNTVYGTGSATGNTGYTYVKIDDKYYTVTAPASSNTEQEHVMHGLSLKSDSKGTWDWDVVASYFHQNKDLVRASTGNFGLDASDGPTVVKGTIADASGTGWKTLDLRGDWRPEGDLKSKHQVSFGYHYDNYETKTDTYNIATDWRTGVAGTLSSNSRGQTETQALYLQDAWQLHPDWKLVAGGRWEKWNAFNGSNTVSTTVTTYGDRTVDAFSPKASLTFQATDDWSLRSSYGRGVRFPTVGELFTNQGIKDKNGGTVPSATINADPILKSLSITNNPNLKPERVNSFELTAEKTLARGLWRTSWFFENKEDALISQADNTTLANYGPGYQISSIQNVDKVRTKGVEMSLQLKDLWINRFDLNGSVTYVDSTITKDSKNPGLEGTDQPRIPDWRATLMGIYRANDKLSFSLAGRYSGRQHNSLYDTVNKKYTDVNPNVYGAVSHYFVVDAKAVYKMSDRWESALGVNNLNNFKYYVNPNPYPQRTWFASLKFDY